MNFWTRIPRIRVSRHKRPFGIVKRRLGWSWIREVLGDSTVSSQTRRHIEAVERVFGISSLWELKDNVNRAAAPRLWQVDGGKTNPTSIFQKYQVGKSSAQEFNFLSNPGHHSSAPFEAHFLRESHSRLKLDDLSRL